MHHKWSVPTTQSPTAQAWLSLKIHSSVGGLHVHGSEFQSRGHVFIIIHKIPAAEFVKMTAEVCVKLIRNLNLVNPVSL